MASGVFAQVLSTLGFFFFFLFVCCCSFVFKAGSLTVLDLAVQSQLTDQPAPASTRLCCHRVGLQECTATPGLSIISGTSWKARPLLTKLSAISLEKEGGQYVWGGGYVYW